MLDFSVLLSVYFKEKPEFLQIALNSLVNQSKLPNEIVIVKDGQLTKELDIIIEAFRSNYPDLLVIVELKENIGLGGALQEGLKHCKYQWVARMDADDICFPDRFEKQFDYIDSNPEITILGTALEEFEYVPGDIGRIKKQPSDYLRLFAYAKKRCPLNHPTVVFRKDAILKVGSYQKMPFFEDYYLWIRLLKNNYKMENLNIPLLHFRTGNDMIGRRHGWAYMVYEVNFLNAVRKTKFINIKDFCFALITRVPMRLIPKKVLTIVYSKFLRK